MKVKHADLYRDDLAKRPSEGRLRKSLALLTLALLLCACTQIRTLDAASTTYTVEAEAEHTIEDPEASGEQAAILYSSAQRATFALDEVPSGTYKVSVRARADEYEGWPVMRLRVGDQVIGEGSVERESYGEAAQSFGEEALEQGQTITAEFVNDLFEGSPEKDRNLIVDHLTLEPVDAPASAPETPTSLPAFPGAEGFGNTTVHGRGGHVIAVTNLDDAGPGSLREALEAEGPRIVVFRVGGLIELEDEIYVTNPYLMVAGQTAPGDGVTLKNAGITVATHDVVLRHLRGRPGDGGGGQDPENRDSFQIISYERDGDFVEVYNVVFDHLSASWAIDEVMSTWGDLKEDGVIHDVTIQWSVIAEGLDDSDHPKGPHSKGLLIGDGTERITVHHNLFAHNSQRHPLFKAGTSGQVINNVLYNSPRGTGLSNYEDTDKPIFIDLIGNTYKAGPDSGDKTQGLTLDSDETPDGSQIYVQGNVSPQRPTDEGDEWRVAQVDGDPVPYRATAPVLGTPAVQITPTQEAYEAGLAGAGATLPARDSIDARIVADVRNGTGRIIDSPAEVGGYPAYGAGVAPADSDKDGMPDAWEEAHGFAPEDAADGSGDADGDGYTNVEEFLNGTNP